MATDSRKLHIIEAVLHAEDEKILSDLESIISQFKKENKKPSAFDFVGLIEESDLKLINRAIDEGCEKINPDDWK